MCVRHFLVAFLYCPSYKLRNLYARVTHIMHDRCEENSYGICFSENVFNLDSHTIRKNSKIKISKLPKERLYFILNFRFIAFRWIPYILLAKIVLFSCSMIISTNKALLLEDINTLR